MTEVISSEDGKLELDIQTIPAGMYLILIETDAGIFTGPFVKQ
jgi:hypothetical protein